MINAYEEKCFIFHLENGFRQKIVNIKNLNFSGNIEFSKKSVGIKVYCNSSLCKIPVKINEHCRKFRHPGNSRERTKRGVVSTAPCHVFSPTLGAESERERETCYQFGHYVWIDIRMRNIFFKDELFEKQKSFEIN